MGSMIPVALRFDDAISADALLGMGDGFRIKVENILKRYGDRIDSEGNDAIDRYRLDTLKVCQDRVDSLAVDKTRNDSFGDASGWWQPRELEYQYQQVLEEKRPMLNGLRLFPVDTRVPAGARTHTVSRQYSQAEAVYYRNGVEVPLAQVSKDQEQFPVRYIVSGFETSDFENMSAAYAGGSPTPFKQRAAIRAIEEKMNRAIWYGDATEGLKGIFDYPYLQTRVAPYNYATGTPDDILADMHDAKNWPVENSREVFDPTAVVTSIRVRNKVMQRPRNTNSDMTVGQMWLRDNGSIQTIETAQECQGQGPSGEDAMLFYRPEMETVAVVMPQGPTIMPEQRQGFMRRTYIWAAYGGVVLRDSGNVLLNWVDVS